MKTFLIAVLIVTVALLIATSGSFLSPSSPSYSELVGRTDELTWQLKYKQDELDMLKQDIQDGLVPCTTKEKP